MSSLKRGKRGLTEWTPGKKTAPRRCPHCNHRLRANDAEFAEHVRDCAASKARTRDGEMVNDPVAAVRATYGYGVDTGATCSTAGDLVWLEFWTEVRRRLERFWSGAASG